MSVSDRNKEQLRKIKHKIERLENRIAKMKEGNTSRKDKGAILTEHAGWGVGYYQGQLSVYEVWSDDLEEELKREEEGS